MSRFIPISRKVEILNFIDLGNSNRKTAEKFNIAKSTVQRLKREKDSLKYYVNDGTYSDTTLVQHKEHETHSNTNLLQHKEHETPSDTTSFYHKNRETETCNINSLVLIWFERMNNSNFLVSGASIKAAAKSIAHKVGNFNFKASKGWLKSFLNQQGMSLKSLKGELLSSSLINEILPSAKQEGVEHENVSSEEFREQLKRPKIEKVPECSEFSVHSFEMNSPNHSESSSDFIIKGHYRN